MGNAQLDKSARVRKSSPPPHRRDAETTTTRAALRLAGVVTPAAEGACSTARGYIHHVPRSMAAVNLPMRVAPRAMPWDDDDAAASTSNDRSTAEMTVEATAAPEAEQAHTRGQRPEQRTADRSAESEGDENETGRADDDDQLEVLEVERSLLREHRMLADDREVWLDAAIATWSRLSSSARPVHLPHPPAMTMAMAAGGEHGAQPPPLPHTQRLHRAHNTKRLTHTLNRLMTCVSEKPPLLPAPPPKPPTPRNDYAMERRANPSPCTAAAMAATMQTSLVKRSDRALRAMMMLRDKTNGQEETGEVVEYLPFVRLRPSSDRELAAVEEMLAAERCAR